MDPAEEPEAHQTAFPVRVHTRSTTEETMTGKTPWVLVRKRTIPTGRPPLVGEY
jgi:hypothetical protein